MFIKEVIISGVKSYKEKSTIEFTPGVNLIIGKNGSGKSNLLSAIELVLMKDSEFPKGKECLLLMHGNKPGQETYVEVVFDNTDRMLPFDSDTVNFRRVIGIKKVQLLINGKEAPQLQSVLQSSGFLNPFFFVRQGRINDIATCTDEYRLQLIKKFVGHELWDEKAKIINNRMENVKQIGESVKSELVESIKELIVLIRQEVEQLKVFSKLKKKSDAVEYALLAKQYENYNSKLEELEREKTILVKNMKSKKQLLEKQEENVLTVENEITKVKKDIKDKEEEKIETENRLEDLIKLKASFENSLSSVTSEKSEKQLHLSEIENLKKEISTMKPDLLKTEQELQESKAREKKLVIQITKCEDELEKLNPEKIPVESKEEMEKRKRYILGEVKALDSTLAKIKAETDQYHRQIQISTKERNESVINIQGIEKEKAEFEQKLRKLKEGQRMNWTLQSQLERTLARIGEQMEALQDSIRKLAGKSILDGINGMRTVLENLRNAGTPEAIEAVDGYYGLLCENINTDQNLRIAVQVAAGKKLFYHVVKNKEIGKIFMKEFNRLKLSGEVFFLPEEDVFVPNIPTVPTLKHCSLLLSHVTADPRIERTLKFVFQKYLVCRSMDQVPKTKGVNLVTLDGDKRLDNGVIQGGYFQQTNTALHVYDTMKVLEQESQTSMDKKRECESRGEQLVQSISEDTINLNSRENMIARANSQFDRLDFELKALMLKQHFANEIKRKTEDRIENLQTTLAILDVHLQSFKDNGKGKTSKREKIDKYKEVKTKLHNLNAENKTCFVKRMSLEKKKEILETGIRLRQTLITSKENALLISKDPILSQEVRSEIQELRSKISQCKRMLIQMTQELEILEKKITQHKDRLNNFFESKVKLEEELNTMGVKHDGHVLICSKFAEKRNAISTKMQSLDPSSAQNNRFLSASKQDLTRRLAILSQELKKNPVLNQEAEIQLESLETRLKKEMDRMELLEKRANAVQEMMLCIELTKAKSVLSTCHQLQQNFRELFSKLVGTGGYAKLVLYGTDTASEIHETSVYTEPNICKLWTEGKFTAAKINATFKRGWTASTLTETRSLSGGQKTLIALAFILAVQKCEPSALYLFDEIDQALDTTNRRAISQILREQSDDSQFICTTFQKELVGIAGKVHGVSFVNKTSVVKELSPGDALAFIRNNKRPDTSDRENEDIESVASGSSI